MLGFFILIGAGIADFAKGRFIEQLSISIALGTMLSLAILELLPEAMEYFSGKRLPFLLLFIAAGAIFLKVLDQAAPAHGHCHGGETACRDQEIVHVGVTASAAIIIHNLVEGMAVYSVAASSLKLGLLMALGVGLHNIPMGMIVFSTLKHERKKIRGIFLGLVSLSTFIGGLLMSFVGGLHNEFFMGALISLALGMLLYIVVMELLPYVLSSRPKRLSAAGVACGAVIMLVSSLLG